MAWLGDGRSWLVAAALVASGCSYERPEAAEPGPPGVDEPAPEVVPQANATARPMLLADVVRNPGGLATMGGASLLVPGYPGSALVAFDMTGATIECVVAARLTVGHVGGEALPIDAWVSLEDDLPTLPDGADLGGQVIARGSPSVRAEPEGGSYEWDVTELLRWSHDHQSPEVFVVALKPHYVDSTTTAAVELGASESGAGAVLAVDRSPDCETG